MAFFFSPNENQIATLELFKAALIEKNVFVKERHDDHLLYRFLRARKFDLEKTLLMFINAEEWRKNTNVDDVVANFSYPEQDKIFEYYPRFYHKTDKYGRTVYIEKLKNLDVPALFSFTTQERFLTKHVRDFEKFTRYRLPACSIKANKHIEQGTSILDLKGVPLSQFNQVRKIIQSISAISSDYYPEHMGKLVMINSPMLFTAIWTIIKSFLDENTVAKISILGSSYEKELLTFIDKENLPISLGGTCDCPGGCEHSDLGPWNDGTVPGYPQKFWEDFKTRDVPLNPEAAPTQSNESPQ